MEIVVSILLGLGLAASAGFRVFLPLLVANIASLTGWLNFSEGFGWMGSWTAFAVFLTATIAEVSAYYIPWLDNALDAIAIPLAAVAGSLLSVSFITDVNPMIQWTLGIIAGGGTAALVKTASGALRTGSSAMTGGTANWILSSLENLSSFLMSFLSVFIPVLAGTIAIIVTAYCLWKLIGKRVFNARRNSL